MPRSELDKVDEAIYNLCKSEGQPLMDYRYDSCLLTDPNFGEKVRIQDITAHGTRKALQERVNVHFHESEPKLTLS